MKSSGNVFNDILIKKFQNFVSKVKQLFTPVKSVRVKIPYRLICSIIDSTFYRHLHLSVREACVPGFPRVNEQLKILENIFSGNIYTMKRSLLFHINCIVIYLKFNAICIAFYKGVYLHLRQLKTHTTYQLILFITKLQLMYLSYTIFKCIKCIVLNVVST